MLYSDAPYTELGRTRGGRISLKMQDAISALQLDDDGNPDPALRRPPRLQSGPSRNKTTASSRATAVISNTDNDEDEDKDYEDCPPLIDIEDSDDDDDNLVSNAEVSSLLITHQVY